MRLHVSRPAAAAALAAAFLLQSAAPSHALFGFGKKAPPAPAPVAAVGAIEGSAQYQAAGSAGWAPLAMGQRVMTGDTIKTPKGSKVIVAFSDGSKVQVGEAATFSLEVLEPKKIGVKIGIGILDAWVAKVKSRRFQLRSPTAVASVRGTQLQLNVDASGNTDFVCVTGNFDVGNNAGQSVNVGAGMQVEAQSDGKVSEPVAAPPALIAAAPVEPVVAIPAAEPPAAETAPAPEPKKAEPEKKAAAPAPETAPADAPADAPPANEPPPPPPPNPSQDTHTVSPSSP